MKKAFMCSDDGKFTQWVIDDVSTYKNSSFIDSLWEYYE